MATALMTLAACASRGGSGDFTTQEISLIQSSDSIMRVLTIEDPADLEVLRATSTDLSCKALQSEDYASLCKLMVATVTHPSQDGVGIAGPQVGLNRRVVAVQRFDKEPILNAAGKVDHPFEVYPNIRIVWKSDSLEAGPEGCLSVPDRRGDVMRSTEIVIEYADLSGCCGDSECAGCAEGEVRMIQERISGFTAVIFQHEVDHLDGILYIDRL